MGHIRDRIGLLRIRQRAAGPVGEARGLVQLLAGYLAPPETGKDLYVRPVPVLPAPSQRATEAQFNADGDLVEVRGNVIFGNRSSLYGADNSLASLERRGFDQVNLTSQGDLHFLGV